MTPASLRRLVARGEGPTLELKRSTSELREGLESAGAFLNTAGGCVLFGVNRSNRWRGEFVARA